MSVIGQYTHPAQFEPLLPQSGLDELRARCEWFIETCADQVEFMSRMLKLDEMKARITALVTYRAAMDKEIPKEPLCPCTTCSWRGQRPGLSFSR